MGITEELGERREGLRRRRSSVDRSGTVEVLRCYRCRLLVSSRFFRLEPRFFNELT